MSKSNPLLFMVVFILGAVLLLIAGGGIVLELNDHKMPENLVSLSFTAIGALGALLVPSETKKDS